VQALPLRLSGSRLAAGINQHRFVTLRIAPTADHSNGSPSMHARTHRHFGIRTRLILVALASSLPLAGFAAFMTYRFVEREYATMQQSVLDRARLLSEAVDQQVADVEGNLRTLAASPAIGSGDLRAFYQHAVEVNRVSRGVGIALLDRSGRQLVHTMREFGAPLGQRSNLETQDRVFQTGKSQISDLVIGTLLGQPIVSIEVPVQVAGEVRYVLALGFAPEHLTQILQEQWFPSAWRAGIVDRKGILISRIPDPERFIGRPAGGMLAAQPGRDTARWVKSVTSDGVEVYGTYWRSALTGWTVALGVPRSAVDTPYWWTVATVGAVAATVVLLGLLIAIFSSRLIVRPLAALERAAEALGRGTGWREPATGVREIENVHKALQQAGAQRRAAEDALRGERALLDAVVRSMPVGVIVAEAPSGRFLLANDEMRRLWEGDWQNLDELADHQRNHRFYPDGRPYDPMDLPIARTLIRGVSVSDEEITWENPSGRRGTILVNSAPVKDADGRVVAAVAAIFDITDRKQAMERQKLLLDEINHRTKNAMATIQAIARLSSRTATSFEEFVLGFQARLVALSHAYDLLTRYRWEGADLTDVIQTTLAPHLQGERISIDGRNIYLRPKQALALTSGIHELATNSVKYGALSTPAGQVEISWTIPETGHDAAVRLTWLERGGPGVARLERRGFGTRFVEQVLPAELDGRVTLEFLGTGVRCVIYFPINQRSAAREQRAASGG
jgi:two-component sensor histidine kinase